MAGKSQYTKENLVKGIRALAKKLGKSPSTKDLRRNGLPKQETIKKYFESDATWNDVLAQCQLSPLSQKYTDHWNKADIENWVSTFRKKHGRLPTRRDSTNFAGPSSYSVKGIFGSWTRVLQETSGSAYRRFYSKQDCINYVQKLGKYHTVDQLRVLAKIFGNPHPDTIRDQTGLTAPDLQEKLGFGRKYGVFGKYPVLWELFCEEVCQLLYKKISRQYSIRTKNCLRRPDIVIKDKNLIVEAMTSAYDTAFKRNELLAYSNLGYRIECWCITKGTELEIGKTSYLYPQQIQNRIESSNLSDGKKKYLKSKLKIFVYRPDNLLIELGRTTRKQLIADLKRRASELGNVPQQTDMKPSLGYLSYQVYARTFGSWNKALVAAHMHPPFRSEWTKNEIVLSLKKLKKELGRDPVCSDLKFRRDVPSYGAIRRHYSSFNRAIANK